LRFRQIAVRASFQQRLHVNAGAPQAIAEPSCLVHFFDGFADYRYGGVEITACGPLPGDPQLGDRDQEENAFTPTCTESLLHQFPPTVTVGGGDLMQ